MRASESAVALGREPERRPKIALFVPDLSGGGAERVMVNIANGLVTRGPEVDLVLVRKHGAYLSLVDPAVRVVELGSRGVATGLPRLTRYLRSAQPLAALSTLSYANVGLVAARAFARLAGGSRTRVYVREPSTPSQVEVATTDVRGQATELLRRWAYNGADGVVAVSEGAAKDVAESVGVPAERIHTIYNPVVDESIAELANEALDDPWFAHDAPPVILGVGRLGPEKDFETLLRAFAAVRAERDVRLVILGEGASRSRLEQQVEELGLAQSVRLPGFVDNPYAYMARAALYVCSSVREGLPGALIQAMACGCTVVSTDCPSGPYEVLDGGRFGELVPMRDPSAMAQAIERGLNQPADAERLKGRAGEFSIERSVSAYERLLLTGASS